LLNARSLDFAMREEGLRPGSDIDGAWLGEAQDGLFRMVGPDFEGVVLLAAIESAWDMDGSWEKFLSCLARGVELVRRGVVFESCKGLKCGDVAWGS
jgi:hypothetical protein